jgi:hypothetical protein
MCRTAMFTEAAGARALRLRQISSTIGSCSETMCLLTYLMPVEEDVHGSAHVHLALILIEANAQHSRSNFHAASMGAGCAASRTHLLNGNSLSAVVMCFALVTPYRATRYARYTVCSIHGDCICCWAAHCFGGGFSGVGCSRLLAHRLLTGETGW